MLATDSGRIRVWDIQQPNIAVASRQTRKQRANKGKMRAMHAYDSGLARFLCRICQMMPKELLVPDQSS